MSKLTSTDAARIIQKSDQTVRRHVHDGKLKAWREGISGKMWIEIDDLRQFAAQYGQFFDEKLATQIAQN